MLTVIYIFGIIYKNKPKRDNYMKSLKEGRFKGERALFASDGLKITDSVFEDGESPLKESKNIELYNCTFDWKYPLWYCKNVTADKCTLTLHARAGIWYTDNISIKNTLIDAPKTFRRCDGLYLKDVQLTNAEETLWYCKNIKLDNVKAENAPYFGMNSENIEIDRLDLTGNYAFDGVKNIVVRNSRLITKDAFWNSENVTVYNSYIWGEYLGWNSKNLTFIDCTIESLQGLCFIENLKMINCKTENTTLAFEYSTVDAELKGSVGSVFNPKSGIIKAEHIEELIMEKDVINPDETTVICDKIDKISDKPEWKR